MSESLAWLVFLGTYLALALGYVPWLRLDRTGAAFVGAVAMLALGVITLDEAFLAQDYHTLVLLFSMMLVDAVCSLRVTRGGTQVPREPSRGSMRCPLEASQSKARELWGFNTVITLAANNGPRIVS